jgi:beta-lactamase class A
VIGRELEGELRAALAAVGLRASLIARDLDTGRELGLDPHVVWPIASLIKVPLALAVAERLESGELDAARPVDVAPGGVTVPGPMGLTRFRHPARIALEDLLYLATSVSDNVAADALFALVPPAEVADALHRAGLDGIAVRHDLRPLTETPVEQLPADQVHLAHELAIRAGTAGGGHAVAHLDPARANAASASALVDLLAALWTPRPGREAAAARVRGLLRHNVVRHRLAPDFAADDLRWSSKTGTLMHLRHEVGVAEHADGTRIAVAALSASSVAAAVQPAAEAELAHAARRLHDELRAAATP